jgi:hypothetical protein
MWHEEVPQAPRTCLGLEVLHDLRVAVRIAEGLHLFLVDSLCRIHVAVHEGVQLRLQFLAARAGFEVHARASWSKCADSTSASAYPIPLA